MAKTLRSIVLYLYRMVTESLLKIQISLNTAPSPSRICHFVELVIEQPYTGITRLIISLAIAENQKFSGQKVVIGVAP